MIVGQGRGWVVLVDYHPARWLRRWSVRVIDSIHGDEKSPEERERFYLTENGAKVRGEREVQQIKHSLEVLST